MANFIIRRLILTIIVVFIVTIIAFSLMHITPGDPAATMLGPSATQEQIDDLRHELWLDRPVVMQYVHWLDDAVHGNLGKSFFYNQDVTTLLWQRLPVTLYLSLLALLLASVVGIGAGVISAVRRGGWIDNVTSLFANIGVGIPVFWLGILGIYFIGLKLDWLPIYGYTSPFSDFAKSSKQAIMPVICLAVPLLAVLARQTRSSMLEVIRQDYIRTARAKGLTEIVIVFKHALKNAFIPVITMIGLNTRILIGGSVLVETVFNIPGVGRLLVQSCLGKDYVVIQAAVLLISVVVCLATLAVDISYRWLDPRIKFG